MKTCTHCGNNTIDSGSILSAGKIAYKSDKLSYPFEGGNVRSYVCTKCGYIESYVTGEYLVKITESDK